jgi:hypothetical protein
LRLRGQGSSPHTAPAAHIKALTTCIKHYMLGLCRYATLLLLLLYWSLCNARPEPRQDA